MGVRRTARQAAASRRNGKKNKRRRGAARAHLKKGLAHGRTPQGRKNRRAGAKRYAKGVAYAAASAYLVAGVTSASLTHSLNSAVNGKGSTRKGTFAANTLTHPARIGYSVARKRLAKPRKA